MEVHIESPLSLANSHRLKDGSGPAPFLVSILSGGQDAVVDLEFLFENGGSYTGMPKEVAAARLVRRAGAGLAGFDFETDAAIMPSVRVPAGAVQEVHMRILPGQLTGRLVRLAASAAPVGDAGAPWCSKDARVISKPPKNASAGGAGRASGKRSTTTHAARRIGGPKAVKMRATPGARRSRAPRSPAHASDSYGSSSPASASGAPTSSTDSDGSVGAPHSPVSVSYDFDQSGRLTAALMAEQQAASELGVRDSSDDSDGLASLPRLCSTLEAPVRFGGSAGDSLSPLSVLGDSDDAAMSLGLLDSDGFVPYAHTLPLSYSSLSV